MAIGPRDLGSEDAWIRFLSRLPDASHVRLILAGLATFGAVGFLVDILLQGRLHPVALAAAVVFFAVPHALRISMVSQRRWRLLALTIAFQVITPIVVLKRYPVADAPLTGQALKVRLIVDGVGALFGVLAGYVLSIHFISREGLRGVRNETEVALARRIHERLVPTVSLAAAGCEMHGRSYPATEVGGDLVDALEIEGRPVGFLADVSGHGVAAGMIMGLLKASFRTRLLEGADVGRTLAAVNDVLADLTEPNAFATGAMVNLESPTRLAYALAGHPPILHWRAASGGVARLAGTGMALGILPGQTYAVAHVDVGAGDVLAILTDGLAESMDRQDRELGLPALEAALARRARAPLPELLDHLLATARAHGPQQDDQTVLLVRVLA